MNIYHVPPHMVAILDRMTELRRDLEALSHDAARRDDELDRLRQELREVADQLDGGDDHA